MKIYFEQGLNKGGHWAMFDAFVLGLHPTLGKSRSIFE